MLPYAVYFRHVYSISSKVYVLFNNDLLNVFLCSYAHQGCTCFIKMQLNSRIVNITL